MSARAAAVLMATLTLLLSIAPAQAFLPTGERWSPGTGVVMSLRLGGSPAPLIDGSLDWNAVGERAAAMWNDILNAISFATARALQSPSVFGNRVNEVAWADDVDGEPFGDTLAVTSWTYRVADHAILEADVIVNRHVSWNSYRGPTRSAAGGGTLHDLRRVLLHEFGHALGLDHPDEAGQTQPTIMTSRVSNVDVLREDDMLGLEAIYGSRPDTLVSGRGLLPGQAAISSNRRFHLVYQGDGNLVLYDQATGAPVWATGTSGAGAALLQGDGNFVVYDNLGGAPWASGTVGNPGSRLLVQSDGNVVIYGAEGQPLWDRSRR